MNYSMHFDAYEKIAQIGIFHFYFILPTIYMYNLGCYNILTQYDNILFCSK